MTKLSRFIHFVSREIEISKGRVIAISGVAGLSNGLLLAVINSAAEQASQAHIENRLFVLYAFAFLLMICSERYSQTVTIAAVEKALQKIRLRITRKVCQADLRFVEESAGVSAFSPLLQGVNNISEAVREVIQVVRESLLLVVACLYILWLSPPTFVAVVIFLMVSIPIGIYYYQKTDDEMEIMEEREERFFERFEAILAGFKELKVNQKERDALFAHVEKLSQDARDLRISANNYLMNEDLLSHVTMYLLIAVAVLVMPQMMPEATGNVHKITAAILFLLGPAGLLVSALPGLSKSAHIISNLYKLENQLDTVNRKNAAIENQTQKQYKRFERISLTQIEFTYQDKNNKALFRAGPFNLEIHSGELLFIVGNNGTGKSTFLKLLTGLYLPDHGSLFLDGHRITPQDYASYRSLFSLVFTDFYLFDRLYGLVDIPDAEVNSWIEKMELQHKTAYKNGFFTNTDLSTGQRKRLAFISAILKKRPICIFDELAADQDPTFRHRFYADILPELQADGRTIIAVTHDENYFRYCDRLIRLENGGILSDSSFALEASYD